MWAGRCPVPATRLRCCKTCGIFYIPRGSWEGKQDRSLRSTPFPPLGKSRKCSAHGLGDRRPPHRLSPWTALHLLQAENQSNLGGCPQAPRPPARLLSQSSSSLLARWTDHPHPALGYQIPSHPSCSEDTTQASSHPPRHIRSSFLYGSPPSTFFHICFSLLL